MWNRNTTPFHMPSLFQIQPLAFQEHCIKVNTSIFLQICIHIDVDIELRNALKLKSNYEYFADKTINVVIHTFQQLLWFFAANSAYYCERLKISAHEMAINLVWVHQQSPTPQQLFQFHQPPSNYNS